MSALDQAAVLRERHRYEEAIALLHQHLAQEPNDAWGHAILAETWLEMPGQRKKAIESIDAAIALEADNATFFGLKSLILSQFDQDKKALEAAEQSIGLDPSLVIGWRAKAQALAGMSRWVEAEESVRKALELDPDDESSQNMLPIMLRMQGRVEESSAGVGQRLSRDPDDPVAHANSGWAALQSGNRQQAEEHFREALRLDPESEYARLGLREAYKARSPVYRGYLKWIFFMQKFSEGQRWMIIIGIYLGYKFGRVMLEQVHPLAAATLVVVYLLFCFWGFLASGTGHALMLADRWARLTLNRREKIDGILVGVFFAIGVVLVILGLTVLPVGFAFLGGGLVIGAIPVSQVTLNNSTAGRIVFGGLTLLAYAAGLAGFVTGLSGGDPFEGPAGGLIVLGILGAVLSTWLSGVPALHSHAEE